MTSGNNIKINSYANDYSKLCDAWLKSPGEVANQPGELRKAVSPEPRVRFAGFQPTSLNHFWRCVGSIPNFDALP